MERNPAAVPLRNLPANRLEALGRKAPRRKPEGGPAALTSRHLLLISYMVDGCRHQPLCDRIWIDRPVQTEDGTATIRRRPKPDEPLSLIEAADMLRIRRRNARELMTLPIFKTALDLELKRFRDGEAAANLHTLVAIRDDPGLGKAADRKVRMQASMALLGEIGGGGTNVQVNIGVGVSAGYILDLEERDDDQPPTIEHRSE